MITYKTQNLHTGYKHIALDIGYSRDKATCGIMYDGIDEPIELTFGNAINAVKNWIDRNGSCILIVEAVLQPFTTKKGIRISGVISRTVEDGTMALEL